MATLKYLSNYEQEVLVNKKVKEVLDELNVYKKSDYEKVKAVHDYIVQNINYDYNLRNYTAYNAIIDKNVVCQGFASLTYKMLKELDVDVRIISGISNNQNHGWNIVKINDKWYNIDNTWDEGETIDNEVSYKYFLKSPNEFDESHKRDDKFTTYNFNEQYPMAETSFNVTNIPNNDNLSNTYGIVDISNHWAKESIIKYLGFGYISGYPDKTFRPNDTISRAEFIKIVNSTFNINTLDVSSCDLNYIDTPTTSWFYNDIMTAIKYGYIECNNDFFNPNEKITREEVLKIIGIVTESEDSELDKIYNFNDWSEVSEENRTFIEGVIENGFIGGYGDNTIKPNGLISRAEVVTILNRIK